MASQPQQRQPLPPSRIHPLVTVTELIKPGAPIAKEAIIKGVRYGNVPVLQVDVPGSNIPGSRVHNNIILTKLGDPPVVPDTPYTIQFAPSVRNGRKKWRPWTIEIKSRDDHNAFYDATGQQARKPFTLNRAAKESHTYHDTEDPSSSVYSVNPPRSRPFNHFRILPLDVITSKSGLKRSHAFYHKSHPEIFWPNEWGHPPATSQTVSIEECLPPWQQDVGECSTALASEESDADVVASVQDNTIATASDVEPEIPTAKDPAIFRTETETDGPIEPPSRSAHPLAATITHPSISVTCEAFCSTTEDMAPFIGNSPLLPLALNLSTSNLSLAITENSYAIDDHNLEYLAASSSRNGRRMTRENIVPKGSTPLERRRKSI